MSINTLSKFGVPGLNGDRAPVLAPIFNNRWRVLFYGFGDSSSLAPYDLTRQVQSVTIPNLSFDTHELYSYLSIIYVTSRAQWGTLNITFLDDVSNTVRTIIERQAARQQNFFDVTASRAGENYKFAMDISILAGGATAGGSDPNILRTYCLSGCYLQSYDDGTLAYSDASPKSVQVTIRPDNVVVFDHYNTEMLSGVSHEAEIAGRSGILSTGIGAFGDTGVSLNTGGAAVSGSVTLSGSGSGGAANLNLTF